MRNRASSFVLATAVTMGLALLAPGAEAGEAKPGKSVKPPSPVKALQTAARNLSKVKGYSVSVQIEGGISDKEDHAIVQKVVAESYEGKVYGNLMHVPAERAFRNPTKGVALIDGQWRNILSNRKTVLIQRLFAFPETLLGRALAAAPAGARWLDAEAPAAKPADGPAGDPAKPEEPGAKDSADGAGARPEDGRTGKTAVGPDGTAKAGTAAAAVPQPRFVRVEAPPEEALKHFLEVQNSGCLSAG